METTTPKYPALPAAASASTMEEEGDVPAWDGEDPVAYDWRTAPIPGLVGEIAAYVYGSAVYPMMEAAVLTALGLMAGIAGRAYNVSNTGLNLYMLLLAPTGRGKDVMDKSLNALTDGMRPNVARVDDFLGPADFASGQGLVREVGERPSFLSLITEFGVRYKAMANPRANSAEQMIRKILLDLYNASGKQGALRPRAYSDRDKNTKLVRAPAVSLLCESTMHEFYECIGVSEVRSGLLPRFIIVHCTSPCPSKNKSQKITPPDDLIRKLCDVAGRALQVNDTGSDRAPNAIEVEIDAEAQFDIESIDEDLLEIGNADPDSIDNDLGRRVSQNILRVAALLAIGINHIKPTITKECVRWAADFVRSCSEELIGKFKTGAIGTGETQQEAKLKEYIAEYVRMKPSKRIYTYSVGKSLADQPHLIPLRYLRVRAKSCVAFTKDPRGFRTAVNTTVKAMIETGVLMRMTAKQLQQACTTQAEVYSIADIDALRD